MNGCIITIDNREPTHIQGLSWPGALTMVGNLECGDVQVQTPDGDLILIERKTPRDLLDSIKDRRLFNQVAMMVGKTAWAYVLIEGSLESEVKQTQWNWASIQGALISIQELGCAVVYDPDFPGAVERIVNRSRTDVKIPQRREPYIFSPAEQILMSLPGVGSKKAQEYLKEFGNVAFALTALTSAHNDKEYLPGWGKKSRDNLVEALGGALEIKLDD